MYIPCHIFLSDVAARDRVRNAVNKNDDMD